MAAEQLGGKSPEELQGYFTQVLDHIVHARIDSENKFTIFREHRDKLLEQFIGALRFSQITYHFRRDLINGFFAAYSTAWDPEVLKRRPDVFPNYLLGSKMGIFLRDTALEIERPRLKNWQELTLKVTAEEGYNISGGDVVNSDNWFIFKGPRGLPLAASWRQEFIEYYGQEP